MPEKKANNSSTRKEVKNTKFVRDSVTSPSTLTPDSHKKPTKAPNQKPTKK